MFINYFADTERSHPFNLAVARVLMGFYIAWRAASIDVIALTEWPITINEQFLYLYPPSGFEPVLVLEKWLLVFFALSFIVGYRIRLSAFMSSLLLAHFAGLVMVYNWSGRAQSMAIAALLVVLLGLYADRDYLSIDAVRRTKDRSLGELNQTLKGPLEERYRLEALKWCLVTVGVIYFGSGITKVHTGPLLAWTQPENLARWIVTHFDYYQHEFFWGQVLVENQFLLALSTWATIVAEMGLLIAILAGVTVTPILVVLLGMHTIVLLTMGIFFFDSFFFIALFLAFDRVYSWLVSSREIDLVYDEHCYFCARSLYLFKHLDINETVTFYSQHTAPNEYAKADVDFDDEMHVFVDGDVYGGYSAFQELCRQFWITVPLAWIMSLSVIKSLGERTYGYIAANRSRYFVCSAERGAD